MSKNENDLNYKPSLRFLNRLQKKCRFSPFYLPLNPTHPQWFSDTNLLE